MRFSVFKKAGVNRAISSFLILALLSLAPLDFHYHLQHEDESSVHGTDFVGHVLDFHSVLDLDGANHHLKGPQDGHAVEVDNELGLGFKSSSAQQSLLVALILSLVLLLLFPRLLGRRCFPLFDITLASRHRHRVPPTRAPPRVCIS